MQQTTIGRSFTISGIGLHTGKEVTLACHPSEANTGVVFRRTDLPEAPQIQANISLVHSTFRSTCLKKKDIEISTTEHILSALRGMNIDNIIIEVDGPEIPILDGSALPYSEAILGAGVTTLDAEREYLYLDRQIEFVDEQSGAEYTYTPVEDVSDNEITTIIEYNSKVGEQVAIYRHTTDYAKEISPARTFVFVNELELLQQKGVIKGGNVNNAIIFSHKDYSNDKVKELAAQFNVDESLIIDNGIINGLTLNYSNEPARHKLLDLLGDLYLLRMPIKGKITARRPGHTGNVAFAKMLKAEYQKQKKLKGKPKYDPTQEPLYDTEGVKGLIPHRYPFLLVDKIIELSDTKVVGIKNVTANENFFLGHFPGNPVFPGVLQMEALAQTGGILALNTVENAEEWNTYFLKMDGVKFKRLVRPGDTLILKMELMSPIRRGIFQMYGTVYVGDNIVSEGELTAQLVKKS